MIVCVCVCVCVCACVCLGVSHASQPSAPFGPTTHPSALPFYPFNMWLGRRRCRCRRSCSPSRCVAAAIISAFVLFAHSHRTWLGLPHSVKHCPSAVAVACTHHRTQRVEQALLSAPNLDDPLVEEIAEHWRSDEDDAIATARNWTAEHASGE